MPSKQNLSADNKIIQFVTYLWHSFPNNKIWSKSFSWEVMRSSSISISKLTQQTFVLVKTYWRCLEDVVSVRHVHEDVLKTSWRRLEEDALQTRFKDVFWKTKNCYAEDVFKTSWRRLGKLEIFAGKWQHSK